MNLIRQGRQRVTQPGRSSRQTPPRIIRGGLVVLGAIAALLCTLLASPAAASTPLEQRSASATLATQVVRIVKGDTYWRYAKRYCGTPNAWPAIQAANGYAPTRLPVGATVRIDCSAG